MHMSLALPRPNPTDEYAWRCLPPSPRPTLLQPNHSKGPRQDGKTHLPPTRQTRCRCFNLILMVQSSYGHRQHGKSGFPFFEQRFFCAASQCLVGRSQDLKVPNAEGVLLRNQAPVATEGTLSRRYPRTAGVPRSSTGRRMLLRGLPSSLKHRSFSMNPSLGFMRPMSLFVTSSSSSFLSSVTHSGSCTPQHPSASREC